MDKYPRWFDYEVKLFDANSLDEVNKKLVSLGKDARDVISITIVRGIYMVHYRSKVSESNKVEEGEGYTYPVNKSG